MLEFQRVSQSFFGEKDRSDFEFKPEFISCSTKKDIKMPVDFATYLMSSSPPGFTLYNNLSNNALHRCMSDSQISTLLRPIPVMKSRASPITISHSESETFLSTSAGSPLKSDSPTCVCHSCQTNLLRFSPNSSLFLASDGSEDDDDDEDIDGLACRCRRLSLEDSADSTNSDNDCAHADTALQARSKRVSFADCRGYSLTQVRFMTEPSDTPPKIRPQLLSSSTNGELQSAHDIPPLRLDFPQPASDYYTFREKLKQQSVCLENVILKEFKVLGTIKVKNFSFKKSVCLRVTYDSWNTSEDVEALYVSTGDYNGGSVEYDTFSFEFSVPSSLDPHQPVEFCVQYKCDAGDFWDNNSSHNFRIVLSDYRSPCSTYYTKDFKPNFRDVEIWSEYSTWHLTTPEAPYY